MSVLNHLALFAAMLLLIELIVLILVLLGVAGGLAFGLGWARGKMAGVSVKVNSYAGRGVHFVDLGLNYAALPVIKAAGLVAMVKGTAVAIKQRIDILRGDGQQPVQPRPHMLAPGVPSLPVPPEQTAAVPEPRPHELARSETQIKPLPR